MNDSSKRLAILLLNIIIVFAIIGPIWWFASSCLEETSGEYFCASPQLGHLEFSFTKVGNSLKGTLNYADGRLMDLVPEYSSTTDSKVQLTFEVPKRLLARYKPHHVTLKGSYREGTIIGAIEDLGGLYPVRFERNAVATVYRRLVH